MAKNTTCHIQLVSVAQLARSFSRRAVVAQRKKHSFTMAGTPLNLFGGVASNFGGCLFECSQCSLNKKEARVKLYTSEVSEDIVIPIANASLVTFKACLFLVQNISLSLWLSNIAPVLLWKLKWHLCWLAHLLKRSLLCTFYFIFKYTVTVLIFMSSLLLN